MLRATKHTHLHSHFELVILQKISYVCLLKDRNTDTPHKTPTATDFQD